MERVEGSGPAPLDLPPQSTHNTPIEQRQCMDTHTSTSTNLKQPQNLDTSHVYTLLYPLMLNFCKVLAAMRLNSARN